MFFVFISLVQLNVVKSKSGHYCVKDLQTLRIEGDWMMAIIWLQLLKVVLFSVWRHIVEQKTLENDHEI